MTGKKETIYSIVFSIISKVITYFTLLVLGNLFVKGVYGEAVFIMNLFYLVAALALITGSDLLVPWIIKKKDTRSITYFLLILSSLLSILVLLLSFKYPQIIPLIFLPPLFVISNISKAYLQTKYKYHYIALIGVVYTIISLVSIYLLKNLDTLGIVLGYSIAYFIVTLIYCSLTAKELKELFSNITIKFKPIKQYCKKAITTALVLMSFGMLAWADSIILGWLSTFENVATYNIASPISNLLTIIPVSIGFFLLTRSSKEKQETTKESILLRAIRISFTFSIILSIIISSLSFLILKIFFTQYIGSEIFIVILVMGMVLFAVYHLIYTHALTKLNPKEVFFPIILAGATNIILDIVLIPKFGLYGICIATLVAQLIAFTLLAKKIKLLKNIFSIYVIILFIPLAYYLQHYGLILILPIIPLLFKIKLLEKADLKVILITIKSIFKFKKNNQNIR